MDDKALVEMNAKGRSKLLEPFRLRPFKDLTPECYKMLPPARNAPVPICHTFVPYRPFPPKVKFHPGIDFNPLSQVSVAHLGDHTNHKMFAVSGYKLESGSKYDGRPRWILHNGPNISDAALAMICELPEWTKDDSEGIITVPSTVYANESSVSGDTSNASGDREFMGAQKHRSKPICGAQRYSVTIPLLEKGEMHRSYCSWGMLPEEEFTTRSTTALLSESGK